MVDTCRITRIIAEPGPVDPDTGLRGEPGTTMIYQGKCKVQTYEPYESAVRSGEAVHIEQRYRLHLPVEGPQIMPSDLVEMTASAHNPHLVGAGYRVAGLLEKTWQTARRFLVDWSPE